MSVFVMFSLATGLSMAAAGLPDLATVPPDLAIPALVDGPPAPGRRVRQQLPQYQGTALYHVLYLPTDWQPGRRYPVIVEYAGNGNYKNKYGDVSTGVPEGSKLGYGISGGRGFIWLCLPFVNAAEKKVATQWWGDVPGTIDYCLTAVRQVCERHGGDPDALFLAGFSRGAIACNYIGLHDDRIAPLWRGFIAYSHYDGVRDWPWPGGHDKAAARERFARLRGRPQFVCQEGSTAETRHYLEGLASDSGPTSHSLTQSITFVDIPFRNHNDAWVLRDIPERQRLREWVADVLRDKPAGDRTQPSPTTQPGLSR